MINKFCFLIFFYYFLFKSGERFVMRLNRFLFIESFVIVFSYFIFFGELYVLIF